MIGVAMRALLPRTGCRATRVLAGNVSRVSASHDCVRRIRGLRSWRVGRAGRRYRARSASRAGITEPDSSSSSRRFPVIVIQLRVTCCQICRSLMAYRPGILGGPDALWAAASRL